MSDIIKTVPTIMSAGFMMDNVAFARKKKKTAKGFLKQGVKNIVGASMIQETAKYT